MNREQKQEAVAALRDAFNEAASVVVLHQTGLDAAQTVDLRRKMRAAGAQFRVTKNRLTRIALDGTPYAPLKDLFTGPTAIAFSRDPVAPAKVAVEFAKQAAEKLIILGGALGPKPLDKQGIKELAALPSLDGLRGRIVGLIKAPATKLAGVLQAPVGQLARVIEAYARKAQAAEQLKEIQP